MKTLVIVESPAKAKTIGHFLGPDYQVEASMGHIRDLPTQKQDLPDNVRQEKWSDFAVNVDDKFQPYYVIPSDKRKHITMLKKSLAGADKVLLATDEDREGEAISWHLLEVLKPKVPVERIVFHEITREAIMNALANPRQIDTNLVRAQESRRILDRLFGYRLSPLLWKKIQFGLSAGRVQSPAVRLIVEREEERRNFVSATYSDLEALISHREGKQFKATLSTINDLRVATGKDFDEKGVFKNGGKTVHLNGEQVNNLRQGLMAGLPWKVIAIEESPIAQRPYAPFTTSSLQQEANRKLHFSSRKTMQIAQGLYEGVELGNGERIGLITYMRTDSTTLSEKALRDAQNLIAKIYGQDYVMPARRYQTKTRNAQEAHEAIRPTELQKLPNDIEKYLDRDQFALYELIWKRTIASQMPDAKLLRTTAKIEAVASDGTVTVFTATGKRILFPGFLRAYVEGSDDPSAELSDKEELLPDMQQGQTVNVASVPSDLTLIDLVPKSHSTEPPVRYTEASLVKKLEEEGVGRPSTYAAIISTIQDRGYVVLNKNRQLIPTFNAFMVMNFLRNTFPRYVDIKFTAGMEEDLDLISEGKLQWIDYLHRFYHGNKTQAGLNTEVEKAESTQTEKPRIFLGVDPETNTKVLVKLGRFGPYLSLGESNDSPMADIPSDIPPADLTLEQAIEVLKTKKNNGTCLGNDPKTNEPIYLYKGRYGYYVQRGETPQDKTAPKPQRTQVKNIEPDNITLEMALQYLTLPRTLGEKDGKPVTATIGPYGPYVACEREYRNIPEPESVYTITLEKALELLAKPKVKTKLEEPIDLGEGIFVKPGRFGPYVTDGQTNASLGRGVNPHTLDLESARKLLKDKLETQSAGAAAGGGRDLGEGIFVKTGRFGPYVTNGAINATLHKGTNPDEVTLAEAKELIANKIAKGPAKKYPTRRTTKK